jgi:hypothetical protein
VHTHRIAADPTDHHRCHGARCPAILIEAFGGGVVLTRLRSVEHTLFLRGNPLEGTNAFLFRLLPLEGTNAILVRLLPLEGTNAILVRLLPLEGTNAILVRLLSL